MSRSAALVADDIARFVAHAGGAVGEPKDVAAALAHLILELAHHAVARHQPLVFDARLGMDVDGVGDVVDAVDQLLRAVVAHHSRQRRIGVEQIAGRRRHINAVDRALEQFPVALFGEALLGECAHRRLARRIGLLQRTAEHFGRTRDVADLVVEVGGRDGGVFLARRKRANGACDLGERTDRPAHHEAGRENADQNPDGAKHDALPSRFRQRTGKVTRQHVAAPVADFAQQFGDAADQPALGSQHLAVDVGDLPLADGHGHDGLGIIVHRRPQPGIANIQRPHVLRGLLCRGRVAREQPERDAALRLGQARGQLAVGGACDDGVELLAQRGGVGEQLGATIDQGRDPLEAGAISGKPLGDPVDHVLLLGRELDAGLLQDVAERRGRLADLLELGAGAGIGDEVARGKAQFVHAAVDVLGEVADALEPLQLRKGRVDVPNRDHARGRCDDDHRQHEQEAAEGELADGEREGSLFLRGRRQFGGHWCLWGTGLLRPNIRRIAARGNMPRAADYP